MPPPTFSDTAITNCHSDTTIFQLRAHWVMISWSIGSDKSFRRAPGGSRTLDFLRSRRAPYPLGQALPSANYGKLKSLYIGVKVLMVNSVVIALSLIMPDLLDYQSRGCSFYSPLPLLQFHLRMIFVLVGLLIQVHTPTIMPAQLLIGALVGSVLAC